MGVHGGTPLQIGPVANDGQIVMKMLYWTAMITIVIVCKRHVVIVASLRDARI